MPLWLYVPGEGPRKDCGGEVVSRDTLSRRREIGRRGGRGGGRVYNEAYMPPTQISR